jgi:hypothetical protein
MLTTEQKQQLVVKATKDEAFRAALLQDAKAAASAALQLTLPAEYRLHVLQTDPQQISLVLPPYPADWPSQLSVDDLLQRLRQGKPAAEAAQERVIDGQITLLDKAWHDAAYKQALLQDPKEVIRREFGEGLPAEVAVQAVAEDAYTRYLVLPPALDDLELSDEQLEQVAGGEVVVVATVFLGAIVVTAFGGSAMVTSAVMTGVNAGW